MKFAAMCTLLVSVSLGLAACNKVKSPDDVQANVAKATSEPAENNAKADAQRKQAEAQGI
jgi:predicted small secreted protein